MSDVPLPAIHNCEPRLQLFVSAVRRLSFPNISQWDPFGTKAVRGCKSAAGKVRWDEGRGMFMARCGLRDDNRCTPKVEQEQKRWNILEHILDIFRLVLACCGQVLYGCHKQWWYWSALISWSFSVALSVSVCCYKICLGHIWPFLAPSSPYACGNRICVLHIVACEFIWCISSSMYVYEIVWWHMVTKKLEHDGTCGNNILMIINVSQRFSV